ncbi:hypothetical protein SCHPADRAFT_947440 [Schizopora paradoxa]|uniref:Uncharacterized protein n=1 Tax=Schizopora paradoxa TaxID=27342 RepID=A0A0H2RIY1_9AGAM|nr:hypothetical protein SCHPADRAFT_947440 [Schizopora paradoxa]
MSMESQLTPSLASLLKVKVGGLEAYAREHEISEVDAKNVIRIRMEKLARKAEVKLGPRDGCDPDFDHTTSIGIIPDRVGKVFEICQKPGDQCHSKVLFEVGTELLIAFKRDAAAILYAKQLFELKDGFRPPRRKDAVWSVAKPPPRAHHTPSQPTSRGSTVSPSKSISNSGTPRYSQTPSRAHTEPPVPAISTTGRSSSLRAQTLSPSNTIPGTPTRIKGTSSFGNTTISSASLEIPLTQAVRAVAGATPTKFKSLYEDGSDSDGKISTPKKRSTPDESSVSSESDEDIQNTSTPKKVGLGSERSVSAGSEDVPNSQRTDSSKGPFGTFKVLALPEVKTLTHPALKRGAVPDEDNELFVPMTHSMTMDAQKAFRNKSKDNGMKTPVKGKPDAANGTNVNLASDVSTKTPIEAGKDARSSTARAVEQASTPGSGKVFGIMIQGVFTPDPCVEIGFMENQEYTMVGVAENGVYTPAGFMRDGDFVPKRYGIVTESVQCSSSTKRRISAHPGDVIDLTLDESPVKLKKAKVHSFKQGSSKGKERETSLTESDIEVIELLD